MCLASFFGPYKKKSDFLFLGGWRRQYCGPIFNHGYIVSYMSNLPQVLILVKQ